MRSKMAALFFAALLLAAEPKPLDEKQRAEALAAALSTLRAENAINQLELQYREAREKLIAEYEKRFKAEQATMKRLQDESGAAGCSLGDKAEVWVCDKKAKE